VRDFSRASPIRCTTASISELISWVPEPQDLVSRIAQKLSSTFVARQFVCVLGTIDLDDQLCLWAKEIREKWADGMLTAELESFELAAA